MLPVQHKATILTIINNWVNRDNFQLNINQNTISTIQENELEQMCL